MNDQLHRIVFNRARGIYMAVAETALGHGRASSGSSGGAARRALGLTVHPLAASLWLGLGMVTMACSADAQIVVDRSAPRNQQPTVLPTPTGAVQVNIQTPSAGGVSRNTYSQFDVGAPGAVLNNSRTGAPSALAGAVGANPWLAAGTARVILNEVNSSNPSQLRGYIEVAGDKAQVVIANPAGITCDGCGFVNASRATVTTGTAVINQGNLESYRVERGTVAIEGAGMDARGADYTDIIARSVKVNAGVWANKLKVTQGANLVKVDNSHAVAQAGQGAAPAVGIDVSELGGMYAGHITLVGTEAGVGVRNAGALVAHAGEVVVTADGRLVNVGQISSEGNLLANAAGGVDNSGSLYAKGNTRLETRGHIRNTGTGFIGAAGNLNLHATGADSRVQTDKDSTLAAGLSTSDDGEATQIGTSGDLFIEATDRALLRGQGVAGGDIHVSSKAIDAAGAQFSGQNLLFVALQGEFDATGAALLATGRLQARIAQTIRFDDATLSGATLDLAAGGLSNRKGQLVQTGEGPLSLVLTGTLDNSAGVIVAQAGGIEIASASVINEGGHVSAEGPLKVTALGALDNRGGTLAADGALDVRGASLDNREGYIGGGDVQVDTHDAALDNRAGLIQADGTLRIDTHGHALLNSASGDKGGLLSTGAMSVEAGAVDNAAGRIWAGAGGSFNGHAIDNSAGGSIGGLGSATFVAAALDNRSGEVQFSEGVRIDLGTGTLDNTGSLIRAGGSLEVRAGTVVNADTREGLLGLQGASVRVDAHVIGNVDGAILADNDVTLGSGGRIDNTGGLVSAVGTLSLLDTGSADLQHNTLAISNAGGTMVAGRHVGVDASQISFDGKVYSSGTLDLRVNTDLTDVGDLRAAGLATFTTTGQFTFDGRIEAGDGVAIHAQRIDVGANGSIISAGSTLLQSDTSITNRGLIDGAHTTLLAETSVDNIGGRVYGDHTSVQAETVNNTSDIVLTYMVTDAQTGEARPYHTPWNGSFYGEVDHLWIDTKLGVIGGRARLDVAANEVHVTSGAELLSEGNVHFGRTLDAQGQVQGRGELLQVTGGAVRAAGETFYGMERVIVERDQPVVISTRAATGFTPTTEQTVLWDTGGSGNYRTVESVTTTQTEHYFNEAASGRAGVLESGGSMHFGDARVHNDQSRIVSLGTVDLRLDHYTTGTYSGERATTVSTTTYSMYRDKCKDLETCSHKNHRTYVEEESVTSSLDNPDNLSEALDLSTAELRGTNINLRGRADGVQGVDIADAATPSPSAGGPSAVGTTGGADADPAGGVADPTVLHRAATVNLTLPTGGLYAQQRDAGAPVLVTTDAQFSGYRTWLDSNYLLTQLGVAPGSLGPRLGDGYYEQRLVREQTNQLVGTRLLDAHQNNETEYLLLMNAGVAFAKAHNLQLGQALTPEQLAKLTTDIVWMVHRDVTRADGSTVRALVPQVYARTTDAEVGASGSLIAGNRVNVTTPGDFTHEGTLIGRDSVRVDAENIHNTGLVRGGSVSMHARNDLDNLGGQITADRLLALEAGRDLAVSSTTRTTGLQIDLGGVRIHEQRTDIDQLGSLTVRGREGQLSLTAGRDVTLTAAALTQAGSAGRTWIEAGRDVRFDTIEARQRSGFHASDDINHLEAQTAQAGTVLVGQGDVTVRAGDNVTARAATVSSEGGLLAVDAVRGGITLQAGVATSLREDARVAVHEGTFKTRTTLTRERAALTQAVGSAFSGQTLLLKAGQDINIQASELTAQDQMQIDAGRDLQVGTFTAYTDTSYQRHSFQRANGLGRLHGFSFNSAGLFDVGYSFLKKTSEDQLRSQRSTQAQGSAISAGTLSTSSGRDTTLVGATVAIENDLRMHAGGNLSLLAAEQTQSDYSRTHSYANGQIGSWWQPAVGTAQQGEEQRGSSTIHVGTQLASLKGSIALSADGKYVQTGSTVAAPDGDIQISARDVQIDAAFDRGESTQSGSSSRSALGGTVSIPLVEALQAARGAVEAGKETRNSRMRGMAAINAGLAANEAATALSQMNQGGVTTGIKVSVNISHNESHSAFSQSGTNVVGSTVAAGGDLRVEAIGAGADSQLNVTGSQLSAGGNTLLKADGAIHLGAAENTAVQKSTDGSSGASLGIGFALLGDQNGFTIDLAASRSRGRADGTDSSWTNSHVTSGKTLTLSSGGDTTLQGAVVDAHRVEGEVAGNLRIESLQDRSTYDSKQESAGLNVSLCVPPICYGTFVSAAGFHFGSTKIQANQRYVAEQSGFFAGDGGYDIRVGGSTDLVGGVIAASPTALEQGLTRFESLGGLTQRDVVNVAEFNADAFAMSAQVSSETSRRNPANGAATSAAPSSGAPEQGGRPTAGVGFGADGEHLESVTRSGVGVSTATDTAGILRPTFNAERTRREMAAQVQITQTFSQKAPQAVARLSDHLMKSAAEQSLQARQYLALWREREAGTLTDPALHDELVRLEQGANMSPERAIATLEDPALRERQELFAEGGVGRIALHALAGAIGGGWQGAAGAGGAAAAAPQLDAIQNRLQASVLQTTRSLGLDDGYARMAGQAGGMLASAGLGSVLGGATGAGFALTTDTNNRQLHRREELDLAARLARASGGRFTAAQIEDAMRASGHTGYGESIIAGMAVGEDGVYDKGAAFWPGKTGDGQVRLGQALRPVDPAVAAFLVAQTGGADSPYINLRPRTSTPQLETQTAPAPRYGRFTANGETFHLKLADCPAVACQNTSPIARFDLNERDQRTLQSYEAAAKEGLHNPFCRSVQLGS